jgi:hypothetical protein
LHWTLRPTRSLNWSAGFSDSGSSSITAGEFQFGLVDDRLLGATYLIWFEVQGIYLNKKPENFGYSAHGYIPAVAGELVEHQKIKVFLFFSSEKKILPFSQDLNFKNRPQHHQPR